MVCIFVYYIFYVVIGVVGGIVGDVAEWGLCFMCLCYCVARNNVIGGGGYDCDWALKQF